MSNPFDYINSINHKEYIFDEQSEKDYDGWMVINGFSYFADTVYLANELNKYSGIPKKAQYDFLFHSISKKKRFSKWSKKERADANLELIMNHYNYSLTKAKEALKILSEEQIESIRQLNYKGGRN